MSEQEPEQEMAWEIRDLALIGDRRTAALVTRTGAVVWYCPTRFDKPSLLAALLDPARGGSWTLEAAGLAPMGRRYLENSGVLETQLALAGSTLTLTDFMPLGEVTPRGLCRLLSPAPAPLKLRLMPAPDYARRAAALRHLGEAVVVDGRHYLYASHPLAIKGDSVLLEVPAGERSWALLLEAPVATPSRKPSREEVEGWLEATLAAWQGLATTDYRGPYAREVAASLRALRLLTYAENGGVVAAPTTSLPEVLGGRRNYDYRYVWLRDAGMIVSALMRSGDGGGEGERFLDFICSARGSSKRLPLAPFVTLDYEPAPAEETLELAGYRGSRPVRIGNGAAEQLQLDAYGNVLLAAKLLYRGRPDRPHWDTVAGLADFLSESWLEPDYGIWEEREKRQYTAGKVIAACGLDSLAQFSDDTAQRRRWQAAVKDIRRFVAGECVTSEGAYAAVAGGEAVDVSAALFPIWGFTAADSPEMLATMTVLERDYATGQLYRRHLERADSRAEGAFLAGSLWVAQYWVMRGDPARAQATLDAALRYANDLGLFAEEADPTSGRMLGNFPQTFVHAAFIGAVVDLKEALEQKGLEQR